MKTFIKSTIKFFQFTASARALHLDFQRLRARLRTKRMLLKYQKNQKLPTRLHFGCGFRKVSGWLNCDIAGSEVDLDLTCGRLPFPTGHFEVVCSQHVIEHLWLIDELQPLLSELNRCLANDGEIWLSCPDLSKVCNLYASPLNVPSSRPERKS